MADRMPPPADLPEDPVSLKQLLHEVWGRLDERDAQLRERNEQLQVRDTRIAELEQHLRLLRQRCFGKSSEKLDPSQLTLGFAEDPKQAEAEARADAETEQRNDRRGRRRDRRTRHRGRRPLPSSLPRVDVLHDVPEAERICRCCGKPMKRIGEEVSEQLECEPAHFRVNRHVRAKYACDACQEGVVVAAKPPQPIEKGLPGAGLLALVLTSKYADHLPLYRLSKIFERSGLDLPRSTLCDWVASAASELEPIARYMKEEVLASRKIHTDETIVPVLDGERDSTRQGRLWVYVGDAQHPHAVFDYTPTRAGQGPIDFLGWAKTPEGERVNKRIFQGYLQADAYSGYDRLFDMAGASVIEVACWAHVRRKFFESKATDEKRAMEMLALIQELYRVERHARKLRPELRKELRRRRSRPILARIFRWIRANARVVLPKSPIGQAITYVLGQRRALARFLEDGILEIDNNLAERVLRGPVVGRKNWLFAGSDEGARRAAICFTLIESCKLHGVDPWAYLKDVLARVATHPCSSIADLTPIGWKLARANAPPG